MDSGLPSITLIPREADADKSTIINSVIKNVNQQMDEDRKTTALKQLQGHMWTDGYSGGELVSQ